MAWIRENRLVQAESCFDMALVLKSLRFSPSTMGVLLGVVLAPFPFCIPGAYGFVMAVAFAIGADALAYSLKTGAGGFVVVVVVGLGDGGLDGE